MCQKELCENPNCDSVEMYRQKGAELAGLEYKTPALAEPRFAYRRL